MEVMEQAAAVVTVLALLAAALWWLKGRGLAAVPGRRRQRRLLAVERLPLGPQHGLCLVRVGERGILLGLSPNGCSVLESGEWSRYESGGTGESRL
jgi:flagellar biogenesis protein FliO